MTPDHFDRFDEMAESLGAVWIEDMGYLIHMASVMRVAKAIRTIARAEWERGNRAGQESMRTQASLHLRSYGYLVAGAKVGALPILDEEPTE